MEKNCEKLQKNKYLGGKIYSIRSYLTDKIYIGSTVQRLSNRLSEHKKDFDRYNNGKLIKYVSSSEIIKYGDAYIELIEDFPCDNKEQLNRREGEFIRKNKDIIVNKRVAGQTNKEYRELNKEKKNKWLITYNENNKEIISKKQKIYREKNKDKLKEGNKVYKEKNKEKIKESNKQYNLINKDLIKAKRCAKVECNLCKTYVSKENIKRHNNTKKHQKNMKSQTLD